MNFSPSAVWLQAGLLTLTSKLIFYKLCNELIVSAQKSMVNLNFENLYKTPYCSLSMFYNIAILNFPNYYH